MKNHDFKTEKRR